LLRRDLISKDKIHVGPPSEAAAVVGQMLPAALGGLGTDQEVGQRDQM
jgi:hypothetical protein